MTASLHPPAAFYRGDTWKIAGTLYNADGSAFDLTTAALEWKMVDCAGNVIFDLTIGNGISIIDAPGGLCLIAVTSAQSGALPVGRYNDQMRATTSSSDVDTMWTGTIEVQRSLFAS